MKIQQAEFVLSAFTLEQLPADALPQVALVGSSNVGKSSLINQLGRSPKLAHTSGTPGRTASINFYRFNRRFYLVDLPGYGYAKVSASVKAAWGPLIDSYLEENERLKGGILVVDIRHPAKPEALRFSGWAANRGVPVVIVANKADKVSRNEQVNSCRRLAADLAVPLEAVIPFSATTGLGRDPLLRAIEGTITL